MKTINYHRTAAIIACTAAFIMAIGASSPLSAQDKKEKTVTATVTAGPSNDKKEKKVTIVAKSDSKDKAGTIKVHIIKEQNGKKTEIDTVLPAKAGMDNADLEELMENVNVRMKDAEGKMKDLEVYINSINDSADADSTGHHKFMFRYPGSGGSHNFYLKECPEGFNYDFEMPPLPELRGFGEGAEHEIIRHYRHAPGVLAEPRRGESLIDILGDIPMDRVKSYKIIDKKGGKRIVIDLVDGPSL